MKLLTIKHKICNGDSFISPAQLRPTPPCTLFTNLPCMQHSAVNTLYFKNQGSDAGRHSTLAGLPATVGCRPKINELIKLYTGYSTVTAYIRPLTAL